MPDLDALVRLVARGVESAREEARRVADELVARGDLGREEAAAIEAAVADAVEANRAWLEARVLAPLRAALRGSGPEAPTLEARLAALEARLARIERKLDGRGAG